MNVADTWTVLNTRHDAHALGQHNSVFTISNGYLGLTGNLAEDRDGYCPATLINGVYDEIDQFGTLRLSNEERRYLNPDEFDKAGRSPAVANLPNPLFVRVFVADCEISFGRGQISNFEQSLDLKTGVYRYSYDHRAAGRTTRVEMTRFASLRHTHRVFMRFAVTALDHSAPICIHSGVSARVHSNTTHERQFRVEAASADSNGVCRLHARTLARQHDVHLAVHNICRGVSPAPKPRGIVEHDAAYTCCEFTLPKGQPITLERAVVLTCSEDARHGVAADLDAELADAVKLGYDAALAEQTVAWAELWGRADVQVEGDERAQLCLRFCLYHLLAAAPRHTDRLSVPAKLLTGEYYQGNVFWDTDLYIVPFYALTFPPFARTCLHYRYKGLVYGRALARELGYRGAKLAWQAGPYGEECLGKWYRFHHTNIHINADAAYALMQYYWATGDEAFFAECGIDILVETARFYAARAAIDTEGTGIVLEDVTGPDEGHCGCTNDFYTNYLAARNLRWAADALANLKRRDQELFNRTSKRLRLDPEEPDYWRTVADQLVLLFDSETKLYEQHAGFYQLKPAPPGLPEDRKEWFATVWPYQALNQPDIVMALVLFRDDFDTDVRRANWEYYKDKSMNFSSMSFAINAIAAADVGDVDEAYRNFLISAGYDLDEELAGRGDTHAGLHAAALGGAWLAAVFGFGGVSLTENGLRINPKLPPPWKKLRFNLMLKGQLVSITIDPEEITLKAGAERSIDIPLTVAGQKKRLRSDTTLRLAYTG
jgi:trehalose/maltose hydrolase-like predicted phosphorylase